MIDLHYSREQMLRDIRATEGAALVGGLADPAELAAFVTLDQARLATEVSTPEAILASLESALAARFSSVPRERLQRDLLAPLKKALGNAYKRGNLMDPQKRITLEVVVTRTGVFVEISDEGAGFDVAGICARFAAGSRYFTHHGSGFRKFHKARAVISFAAGGRTFRACFTSTGETANRPRAAP